MHESPAPVLKDQTPAIPDKSSTSMESSAPSITSAASISEIPASSTESPTTSVISPTTSSAEKPTSSSEKAPLPTGDTYVKYSAVTGYFLQDDRDVDDKTFKYDTSNFGLKDRDYDTDAVFDPNSRKTQWQRFAFKLESLNKPDSTYKLFLFGRHGEGVHNVAEAKYGTEAWDCYYSMLEGANDGLTSWVDATLTHKGKSQAGVASTAFRTALTSGGMPAPESYYVSPLWRCLQTADLTFSPLAAILPELQPFKPTITELFRETIGVHTCDKRSRKSEINVLWHGEKGYVFEEGFAEEDESWSETLRETDEATDWRTHKALENVFAKDKNTWISVTAHSGTIASLLRVTGHRPFRLTTGGVIPVLVRKETVSGKAPVRDGKKYTTVSTCTAPPTKKTPS